MKIELMWNQAISTCRSFKKADDEIKMKLKFSKKVSKEKLRVILPCDEFAHNNISGKIW